LILLFNAINFFKAYHNNETLKVGESVFNTAELNLSFKENQMIAMPSLISNCN